MPIKFNDWKRGNKYHARKTVLDGFTFDSRAEAAHYGKLKMYERAKDITCLRVHPSWELEVNGQLVGKYTADFCFRDTAGALHVQDVKGVKARDFALRCKLMKAIHGIEVEVIS